MERRQLGRSRGTAPGLRKGADTPRPFATAWGGPTESRSLRVERRNHTRHKAHVIMEIRGHLQGPRVSEIRGVTVDMSCGGALAVFNDEFAVDPDSAFMVRFVDPEGTVIAPEFRWGTALRSRQVSSDYVVAVKFQRPLPPAVLGKLLGADLAPAPQGHA